MQLMTAFCSWRYVLFNLARLFSIGKSRRFFACLLSPSLQGQVLNTGSATSVALSVSFQSSDIESVNLNSLSLRRDSADHRPGARSYVHLEYIYNNKPIFQGTSYPQQTQTNRGNC